MEVAETVVQHQTESIDQLEKHTPSPFKATIQITIQHNNTKVTIQIDFLAGYGNRRCNKQTQLKKKCKHRAQSNTHGTVKLRHGTHLVGCAHWNCMGRE